MQYADDLHFSISGAIEDDIGMDKNRSQAGPNVATRSAVKGLCGNPLSSCIDPIDHLLRDCG